jgi:SAM-dependent methyltransferase
MIDGKTEERARARELAAEFRAKGDPKGWFEALYREAEGNNEHIPWADLEPNQFLQKWAERNGLKGDGRKALVVGCGLGDDAAFLNELGFDVTAFDISPTAIEWARKLHSKEPIRFVAVDLFDPPKEWYQAFEFVLEVYTIQPLPIEIRPQVIDSISNFVALGGELLVVSRGREDDEEPAELPWALSRRDLSRFAENGLNEIVFDEITDAEDGQARFIIKYQRPGHPLSQRMMS